MQILEIKLNEFQGRWLTMKEAETCLLRLEGHVWSDFQAREYIQTRAWENFADDQKKRSPGPHY